MIILVSTINISVERFRFSKTGLILKLISVVFAAAAISIDKYLVGMFRLGLVVFVGYLVPMFTYLICRPANWKEQLRIGRGSVFKVSLLLILIYVAIGPIYVAAYSYGSLGQTALISQAKIVLVILLAAIF